MKLTIKQFGVVLPFVFAGLTIIFLKRFHVPPPRSAFQEQGGISFLLLHSNDMHSRFKEVNHDSERCDDETHLSCFGGFARMKAAVDHYTREAKARGKPTLYLDAGDMFQGTVFYTEFKHEVVVDMVNELGIHAMCLGNHEFDDGVEGLAPFIEGVKIPIVCKNLNISQEPSLQHPHLTGSVILNVGGVQVGVIGYLTQDISRRNLGKVVILDEIPSIREEARSLIEQGVNILIALGHSGYDKDQQIAMEVEEIDLVVGGHSHTFLYTGKPPSRNNVRGPYPTVVVQPSGKKVPVVQAKAETKYLGYLEVDFDHNGDLKSFSGLPKLLSGDLPQDEAVLAKLAPYAEKIYNKYQKKLGTTEVFLNGRGAICKFHECNMGNLVTDSFLYHVAKNYNSSDGNPMATIALINSGAIKADLHPASEGHSGIIALEDIISVLPFACELVILRLTGTLLHEVLEQSVSRYDDKKNGMFKAHLLQVSGLRVVFDIARPVNNRVVEVEVRCDSCKTPAYEALDPERTYGVVMPAFLAQGGDFLTMLVGVQPEVKLKEFDYVILSEYIQTHSPIKTEIEGRITILNDPIKHFSEQRLKI